MVFFTFTSRVQIRPGQESESVQSQAGRSKGVLQRPCGLLPRLRGLTSLRSYVIDCWPGGGPQSCSEGEAVALMQRTELRQASMSVANVRSKAGELANTHQRETSEGCGQMEKRNFNFPHVSLRESSVKKRSRWQGGAVKKILNKMSA
jgi:hypothetical protein